MDTDNRWVLTDDLYSLYFNAWKHSRRLNKQNGNTIYLLLVQHQNIITSANMPFKLLTTYLMAQGHLCYHQEAFNAG